MARVVDLRKGTSAPPPKAARPLPLPPATAPRVRRGPLRARRARRRIIIALLLLVLAAGAAWGVSYASYLPALNIQTINVEGSSVVPASLIEAYAQAQLSNGSHPFISPDIVFFFDPVRLENAIAAYFPRIASATISRDSFLATTITISVAEREPYALWCEPSASDNAPAADASSDATSSTDLYDPNAAAGACYEMDQTGYIFATAPAGTPMTGVSAAVASSSVATSTGSASSPQGATTSTVANVAANTMPAPASNYVFSGGLSAPTSATSSEASSTQPLNTSSPIGDSFVPEHVPGIISLLNALGQSGFTATGVQVSGDGEDFTVPLQQGFYLKASFGEDPGTLAQNLQLVLSSSALQGQESDLEYVDLRFGDKVYYKLQGGVDTAAAGD